MTYTCPAWEFEVDTHLRELQRLQNRILCTIENSPRSISVPDMQVAFQIQYVDIHINKLCRQQTRFFRSQYSADVRNIG
jgi:hypothetical protein